ncbi:MAG: hypothetical protein MUE85_07045 [Microscillaceae bacterium]|jgi:hypothetical protein|nr:hypothetical protein [Microscillaceae bacterium]
MTYDLSIVDFYSLLAQNFGQAFEKFIKNHLYPSKILDYLLANNHKFNQLYLQDWVSFENHYLDFDAEDFFSLMGLNHLAEDSFCLLITDDGLKDGLVFQFQLLNYDKFIAFYEDRYGMDFFQPFDYIIFIFDAQFSPQEISMLHHEGWVFWAKIDKLN